MEYDYFHELAAFSVALTTYICLINAPVLEFNQSLTIIVK